MTGAAETGPGAAPDAALRALVRLLAREAAREDVLNAAGPPTDDEVGHDEEDD